MLEAVRNLFRRRARTLLTVFGIAIGVLALTVMGSMAQKVDRMVGGVQQYLQYRIAIGEHGQSPFYGGGLIPSHLAREAARVPGVAVVETTLTLLYHSNQGPTLSLPDTIVGVHLSQLLKAEPLEPPDIRLTFARGGWWKAGAEWAGVIGSSLAREVHARVGHYIRVHGHRFLVTGLLNPTLTSPDTMMFVPMAAAQTLDIEEHPIFNAVPRQDLITNVWAVVGKGHNADRVADRLRKAIPGAVVDSPTQLLAQIASTTTAFYLIVWGSALVALLVGGLSVVNTMVMAVNERVREIGIKKAVGATDLDILKEFVTEAALIGLVGGVVGAALGSVLVGVLNQWSARLGQAIFLLTPGLLEGAMGFAVVLGVVAGLIPAWQAARLDPIQALRRGNP